MLVFSAICVGILTLILFPIGRSPFVDDDGTSWGEFVEPHGAKLLGNERSNRNRIPSPGARNARATDGGVPVAFEDAPVSLSDSSHNGAK